MNSPSKSLLLLCLLIFALGSGFCQTDADEKRDKEFMKLFDMEVQNRAFALRACKSMVEKASSEGDKIFYDAWLELEQFLQKEYAPYAEKYGLSQAPRGIAKFQAGFGGFMSAILPDSMVFKSMLKQTTKYLEKLKELEDIAPEEDHAFFAFIVAQESMQIEALKFRVDGKNQDAADLIRAFVASH